MTAIADVFYPEDDDATEVSDIYLHELSLVNMGKDNDCSDGEEVDVAITLNDDEIKYANTILDHLRFFYNVVW